MTSTQALAPARPAVIMAGAVALCALTLAATPFLSQLLPTLMTPDATATSPAAAQLPVLPGQVAPFILTAMGAERDRAVKCLTDAIYYEAAREPVEGQRAIAQVVVNRVRDPHFPKSICGVVYEGWERRTGCQFSFACDGSIKRRRADPNAWDRLRPIAEQALNGYVETAVGTATHYHAEYVKPVWIKTVAEKAEIGKHIFYSWKGKAGLPGFLRQTYGGGEFKVAVAALEGGRA